MFDVIFSGANEEQQRKANLFEVGLKQRMKEEATAFAELVAGENEPAAETRLRVIESLREVHEAFGKDPRLAALNEWTEKDNAERSKKAMVEAIADRLMSHLR